MNKLLSCVPLILFAACASRPVLDSESYYAAADEAPAKATTPIDHNVVRPIVGGTTDRGGGGFTIAGQYEYRISSDWGAGAFADVVFGDRIVFVLGAGAYWHPVEALSLLGGVGVDFKRDETFARVGGSYEFELKQLKLGPALYVDLGAKGTPVLAGLLFSFDF